jgi:hypothetical protein|tara:strand:- start:468 stop:785 length:318 start_codon:yes stop_codon:yes gene_type:complete
MPSYTFYNSKTKKEYDDMMTIAEMETLLNKNKHIKQVPKGINIVSSTGSRHTKNDSGWNETLAKIGEAHPGSALAQQTTKRTIKQVRTEQAVQKNKKRVADRRKR